MPAFLIKDLVTVKSFIKRFIWGHNYLQFLFSFSLSPEETIYVPEGSTRLMISLSHDTHLEMP